MNLSSPETVANNEKYIDYLFFRSGTDAISLLILFFFWFLSQDHYLSIRSVDLTQRKRISSSAT